MLAEYLQHKLNQYEIARKLADKTLAEIKSVSQSGGAIELTVDEKRILGNTNVKNILAINKSLESLESIQLQSIIDGLNNIGPITPGDNSSTAKQLQILQRILGDIKVSLQTQSQKFIGNKEALEALTQSSPSEQKQPSRRQGSQRRSRSPRKPSTPPQEEE